MNWYRIKTSFIGLKRLATLPEEDKQACVDAYRFFERMQTGEKTETEDETKAVADYYKVLNNMLSIFDVEKLYIPPQLDESEGLYGNQLLIEQFVKVPSIGYGVRERKNLVSLRHADRWSRIRLQHRFESDRKRDRLGHGM
jgi:hypothetical protein